MPRLSWSPRRNSAFSRYSSLIVSSPRKPNFSRIACGLYNKHVINAHSTMPKMHSCRVIPHSRNLDCWELHDETSTQQLSEHCLSELVSRATASLRDIRDWRKSCWVW